MGALLIHPEQLEAVVQLVKPWMFRDVQARNTFAWMAAQGRGGRAHDLDALRVAGLPGEPTAYDTWIDSAPRWTAAVDYAQVVRERRPGLRAALERWRQAGA